MLKIQPYNKYSKSARALARALGVKRLVTERGKLWAARRGTTVVKWGSQQNNKLANLVALDLAEVPVVSFSDTRATAEEWLQKGYMVVCRKLLRASSGRGIVIATTPEELVPAPLYTKYFRKDQEFRVHVFKGEIIDFVKKRRRTGYENYNGYSNHIRVHASGWVYARNNVVRPACVIDAAINAVNALNLPFGAVDIVYRVKAGKETCAVLEVNTAPGLEGKTLDSYVNAVRRYYAEQL